MLCFSSQHWRLASWTFRDNRWAKLRHACSGPLAVVRDVICGLGQRGQGVFWGRVRAGWRRRCTGGGLFGESWGSVGGYQWRDSLLCIFKADRPEISHWRGKTLQDASSQEDVIFVRGTLPEKKEELRNTMQPARDVCNKVLWTKRRYSTAVFGKFLTEQRINGNHISSAVCPLLVRRL